MANRGLSKQAALPAYGVVVSEDVSRLPARCTYNAVVARLDACAAHSARLGIDERQRGVIERTELMDRGSQKQFFQRKDRKRVRKGTRRENSLRYFAK